MKLKSIFALLATSFLAFNAVSCDDSDDEKKTDPLLSCDCTTGENCSEADKAKCSSATTCDCTTGANCSEAEKAACNTPVPDTKCDCTTGANCSEAEKAACSASPEDTAKKLSEYLAACDFENASAYADAAFSKNSSDLMLSYQHAMLGFLNLVNNDKIQALLPSFGFIANNGKVDLMTPIFGSNGLFVQMTNNEHNFEKIWDAIPHKAHQDNDDDILSKTLKLSDIVKTLSDVEPTFVSLAQSFENTAKALADSGKDQVISMTGAGCGLDKVSFHASDLYSMAAVLRIIPAATRLVSAYDTDIVLSDLDNLETPEYDKYVSTEDEAQIDAAKAEANKLCEDYIAQANTILLNHINTIKDASKAKAGRDYFVAAMNDLHEAITLASSAPETAFMGWKYVPDGVRTDITSVLLKVKNNTDGVFEIANVTPKLTVDLKKLFDSPVKFDFNPYCEVNVYGSYGDETNVYIYDSVLISDKSADDNLFKIVNTITGTELFKEMMDEEEYQYCLDHESRSCEWEYERINETECTEECKAACVATEEDKKYCEDYSTTTDIDGKYSANFSSAWGDIDFTKIHNPHNYFGNWDCEDCD